MLHADPPRHDALRSVVDHPFTRETVRDLLVEVVADGVVTE